MRRVTAPLSIAHQEQFPAATIRFDVAPGAALGEAVEAISERRSASRPAGSIVTAASRATRPSSRHRSPASPG